MSAEVGANFKFCRSGSKSLHSDGMRVRNDLSSTEIELIRVCEGTSVAMDVRGLCDQT